MVQPRIIDQTPPDIARQEETRRQAVDLVKRNAQLFNRAITDAHALGAPVDVMVQGDQQGSIPVVVVSRRPRSDLRS